MRMTLKSKRNVAYAANDRLPEASRAARVDYCLGRSQCSPVEPAKKCAVAHEFMRRTQSTLNWRRVSSYSRPRIVTWARVVKFAAVFPACTWR
jgi:hypothetical protein